jgi:LmbE family N-acetylglucosaminyl deacetylase
MKTDPPIVVRRAINRRSMEHLSNEWLLRRDGKPLFIFAHQDDELVLAGLIRRVIGDDERGAFVWWTNGDGLAPGSGMSPDAYARMRIAEATDSLKRLGASEKRKTDLESSEIENYRRITHVAEKGRLHERALAYFEDEATRVERAVRAADPDRVFLLAWQGGHPEHDLVHLMTVRAVDRLRRETGRPIPIIQCPAYEYVIACALRFKPWFRGDRRTIMLSPEELEVKRTVLEAYPSQVSLFEKFRRVMGVVGWAGIVRGRPVSAEEYVSKEEFGVVDPALDYKRSTHRIDLMNYMLDDFEGTPIRFSTMLRPLAEMLLYERDRRPQRGPAEKTGARAPQGLR